MSRIMAELNGDNLNAHQLALRNKAVGELCKYALTQGCQGCSRAQRNEWTQNIHSLPYLKLMDRFEKTFGWPCILE